MIVVGGGSSTRFGTDKLLTEIAGRPLLAHTIDRIIDHVDTCVVVCRPEIVAEVKEINPNVMVTAGGATRTLSEMAGLAALRGEGDLIGIHDAARPAVRGYLVERLFTISARSGGAVPVISPERMIIDRRTHLPVPGLMRAQTPQVFRGPDLMGAYVRAAQAGFEGDDTVEVMHHFSEVTIVGVPGHASNVKVTYPDDLAEVTAWLTDRPHT